MVRKEHGKAQIYQQPATCISNRCLRSTVLIIYEVSANLYAAFITRGSASRLHALCALPVQWGADIISN